MKNISKAAIFTLLNIGLFFSSAQTGNVGINTTAPTNTLHIASAANPLRMEGLQNGASGDKILTVDANGVVRQQAASLGAGVTGLLVGTYTSVGGNSVSITQNSTVNIPGVSISFTPTVNTTAIITLSALPVPGAANRPTQGTVDILQNGTKIASQYYSASDGNPGSSDTTFGLVRLGNYVTTTRQVNLNANTTYTFTAQAKSWRATTVFNVDPTNVSTSYVGALPSDIDAMKTIMNISLYTR